MLDVVAGIRLLTGRVAWVDFLVCMEEWVRWGGGCLDVTTAFPSRFQHNTCVLPPPSPTMPLRNRLPYLPAGDWSANVHSAYDLIQNSYEHAIRILAEEQLDPIRLNVISDGLLNQKPILEAMLEEGLPHAFIRECALRYIEALEELETSANAAQGE